MSKGGIKVQNSIVEWKGDNITIYLKQFASTIDESQLTLMTRVFRESSIAENNRAIKDAAKGL
jgi:hypothetical protein